MNERKSTLAGLLERQCEVAWKVAVSRRDKACRVCKAEYSLHAHHLIGRAQSLALKFYLPNGVLLCAGCHSAAHDSPAALKRLAYNLVGEDGYEALEAIGRKTIYSPGPDYFQEVLTNLRDGEKTSGGKNCDD